MLRVFFFIFVFLFSSTFFFIPGIERNTNISPVSDCYTTYLEMGLDSLVDYAAFEQAVSGYNAISEKKKEIITLIDFTKPSTEKRLYVLDMANHKLLYHSHVSHGRNSGENYATSFSNRNGSYQSSLGFYLTDKTYNGKNGYSLMLDGLDRNFNDKARERAIVIHGASYSNPSVIGPSGRLGRSLGCPALPQEVSKSIINTIKDGSLLYIYADNKDYTQQSVYLKSVRERQNNRFTAQR